MAYLWVSWELSFECIVYHVYFVFKVKLNIDQLILGRKLSTSYFISEKWVGVIQFLRRQNFGIFLTPPSLSIDSLFSKAHSIA